jgi:hypothetical protein
MNTGIFYKYTIHILLLTLLLIANASYASCPGEGQSCTCVSAQGTQTGNQICTGITNCACECSCQKN